MGERLYHVIDTVTITGVGDVMARSKAEAVEKAANGEVQFDYDQGQVVRRGDGLRALRAPAEPSGVEGSEQR